MGSGGSERYEVVLFSAGALDCHQLTASQVDGQPLSLLYLSQSSNGDLASTASYLQTQVANG